MYADVTLKWAWFGFAFFVYGFMPFCVCVCRHRSTRLHFAMFVTFLWLPPRTELFHRTLHVFDEFEIVTNVKVFHLPSHPVAHPQIQILILILIPATTEFASNILLTLSDLYAFLLPPPPLFSPLCQPFSCFFFLATIHSFMAGFAYLPKMP